MLQKVLLSGCVLLLAFISEVWGQSASESRPQPASPLVTSAPQGPPTVPGTSPPDPSVLFPSTHSMDMGLPVLPLEGCQICEAQPQTFWTRPTLTGDWWGARTRLEDRGIKFDGNISQFAFGQSGGINTPLVPPPLAQGGAFAYTGRGDYGVTFDLEKFGGLPKGTLVVRTQQWWGTYANVNLNSGSITLPVFPTVTPTAPNDPGTLFMTDFMLTQPLSKNFAVFAGKKSLAAADDDGGIGGGSGFNRFMNLAVVGNPSLLLAMPYSSFMVGMVSPQEWGSFTIWAMDAKDRTTDVFAFGDLFAEGFILRPQVRFKTNFFGLPGEQRFGGFYKRLDQTDLRFNQPPPGSYPYPTIRGFPTLRDAYTLDYSFEQYFQVYSDETKRGWGVFGRASISDGNPTPYDYYLCLGLGGYSPFRHVQGDQYGIGVYYNGISNEFGPLPRAQLGPRPGWGVEAFYNVQITPWMSLTPDFQIVKPETGAIAETSYIGGVRLNLKF